MVRVTGKDLIYRVERSQKGRRMPYLCALNESQGWRILSEGWTQMTKGLRTQCFCVGETEKSINSLAVADEAGVVAMGSIQRQEDGRYPLYFIKDLSTPAEPVYPRFDLQHTEYLDTPIYSLDWSGPHMLLGAKPALRLYTTHFTEPDDDHTSKMTQVAEFEHPSEQVAAALEAPVPGKYPNNSVIRSIEFASDYSADLVYKAWQPLGVIGETREQHAQQGSSRFCSVLNGWLNTWDALDEKAPQWSSRIDEGPLNCASWSPHAPHALIVTGGTDRALKVVDTRAGKVVWQADDAHARPIRTAKFNTFIPYWLASGGDDGLVNIWDLRGSCHKPVGRISAHASDITSITWSNMRPENLATTSLDGTLRMWILNSKTIPLTDVNYRTHRWSRADTRPMIMRPREKAKWDNWHFPGVQAPWSTIDRHYSYSADEDPWGHSEDMEPDTMLLPSAIGVGEWGSSDQGPVYIGEDFEKSKGAVMAVHKSKTRLADYFCVSRGGQLASQTVRMEKRENLSFIHRYDPTRDPVAYDIEYALYSRRINRAEEDLQKLRTIPVEDAERDEERWVQVKELEEALKTRGPIQPSEWGIDTIPDKRASRRLWNDEDVWDSAVTAFIEDLRHWSHRLPPGYATRYGFALENTVQEMIPSELDIINSLAPDNGTPHSSFASTENPVSPTSSVAGTPASTKSRSLRSTSVRTTSERGSSLSAAPTEDGELSPASPLQPPSPSTLLSRSATQTEPAKSRTSSRSSTTIGHGQTNRLTGRAGALKRMFSRHGNRNHAKEHNEPTQDTQPDTQPPDHLERRRTVRRNALFGTS